MLDENLGCEKFPSQWSRRRPSLIMYMYIVYKLHTCILRVHDIDVYIYSHSDTHIAHPFLFLPMAPQSGPQDRLQPHLHNGLIAILDEALATKKEFDVVQWSSFTQHNTSLYLPRGPRNALNFCMFFWAKVHLTLKNMYIYDRYPRLAWEYVKRGTNSSYMSMHFDVLSGVLTSLALASSRAIPPCVKNYGDT